MVLFPLQQCLAQRKVKNAILAAPTGTSQGFNSNHWCFRINFQVPWTQCAPFLSGTSSSTYLHPFPPAFTALHRFLLSFLCSVLGFITDPSNFIISIFPLYLQLDSLCQGLLNTKSPFKKFCVRAVVTAPPTQGLI